MRGPLRFFEKKERPVIVHYHLFKCAGTSVEQILEKEFREDLFHLDRETPYERIFDQDVLDELNKNLTVKAVTSHQLRMPLPKQKGLKVIPVLFLRHPLDRIHSVYKFDRARGPLTPDAEIAVENDFAGYLRIQMAEKKQVVNFHVKNITDAWDQSEGKIENIGEKAHLARALGVLGQLPVVGVVERYPESASAYQSLIATSFRNFKFQVTESNVSPGRRSNLEDRLAEMQDEIGEDLFEELSSVNASDFALYQAANEHLDAVLAQKIIAHE